MYTPALLPLLSLCFERFCQNEAHDTPNLEYTDSLRASYFGEMVAFHDIQTFSQLVTKLPLKFYQKSLLRGVNTINAGGYSRGGIFGGIVKCKFNP